MDCPDHMFHCSYGPCVARAYVCDGEEDCPLGEDERNCTRNARKDSRIKHELTSCDPGMILCADHAACFPKHWVCDGEPDCLDGSDESDCELSVDNFLAETVTELCHPGEHRCNGGISAHVLPAIDSAPTNTVVDSTEITKECYLLPSGMRRCPAVVFYELFAKTWPVLDKWQWIGSVEISTSHIDIRILVDNKLEYPTGLSIDLIRSDVYFGDVERQMIERVNMDTKQRATSSLKVSELSIHHESAHIIHSFTTLPYGLAINHTMYQPAPSMNPCAGSGCQWICVSIPNVEGEMQPQCLCPDGYKTEENGDCAPIDPTDNTSAEDSNAKPSAAVASMDKSHVGVAWMKERCQAGDGCLNGGQCHEIKNEHGRVTKILCSCESPYEGHRCERLNPEKELAKQIAASKKSIWITVFFIILFLSLFIGAFFISYRYVEPISKTTKSILTSMERRLVTIPPPTMPNLSPIITSMKSRLASTMAARIIVNYCKSTIFDHCRSPRSASVLRTEFTNPLFDDRSSNGSSPEEPVNDATALTYNNPLYVEDTSHAAPFSGIHVTYTNKFTPP
ncbi:Low-density lipoprotein receptor domain class A [Necator americanus]|uniref:Low-density lipoprotein receptor domain class A n=1 Tax=Necator americanus TaxID=51031 RepID=W2THL4_NECAM|nr:Low-density lipoprotein receptor domain class A [Necator americanus]ETN80507.1 Low-density lipoprotein receptor domain class A [Necator americanus]